MRWRRRWREREPRPQARRLSEAQKKRFMTIFEAPDREWVDTVRQLALNNRQKRILVAFHGRDFASADYQRLNRVDRDTAYRDLREMRERQLLEGPDRPGRGAPLRGAG